MAIENECVIYEGLMIKYLTELNYIKSKEIITKLVKLYGTQMSWYLVVSTIKETDFDIVKVEQLIKESCIDSGMDNIDAIIQAMKIKYDILLYDTELGCGIFNDIEKLESMNVGVDKMINLYTLALQRALVEKDTNRIISISTKLESYL